MPQLHPTLFNLHNEANGILELSRISFGSGLSFGRCHSSLVAASNSSTLAITLALKMMDSWLPFSNRVVLEVGCGSGYVICSVALALKHLGKPKCPMLGVDISRKALDATAATLAAHEVRPGQLQAFAGSSLHTMEHKLCWLTPLQHSNAPCGGTCSRSLSALCEDCKYTTPHVVQATTFRAKFSCLHSNHIRSKAHWYVQILLNFSRYLQLQVQLG